jgi:ABC-type transport system substrate-binding protein
MHKRQNTLSSRANLEALSRAEASRGTLCRPVFRSKTPSFLAIAALLAFTLSCASKPNPNTLVMIIESSPTNLDPRVGLDAQSERIDDLIFDDLLTRGTNLDVAPGLARSPTFSTCIAA